MMNYIKMNSLIDSLRANIQKLSEIFNVDVVLQLWRLTMASMAGCDCANNETGKEEREQLIRKYQNAKVELESTLQSITSLRQELDNFYYQHDGFVTESPLWLFVEAPDGYWRKCDSSVDDRLNGAFADECIKLNILQPESEHGGTCGSPEYSLPYVYDLLGNLYGLVQGYSALDEVVASCHNPSPVERERYKSSITSSIKAKQEDILNMLNALQNGLEEAAKRAEPYRREAYITLAS